MDKKTEAEIYERLPELLDMFAGVDSENYVFLSHRCVDALIDGIKSYVRGERLIRTEFNYHFSVEILPDLIHNAKTVFIIVSGFADLGYRIAGLHGLHPTDFGEVVQEISARLGCLDYCDKAIEKLKTGRMDES
jgi:hypothetical protein